MPTIFSRLCRTSLARSSWPIVICAIIGLLNSEFGEEGGNLNQSINTDSWLEPEHWGINFPTVSGRNIGHGHCVITRRDVLDEEVSVPIREEVIVVVSFHVSILAE